MSASLLSALAALAFAAGRLPPDSATTPAATLRAAMLAVQGDSVAAVRARWAPGAGHDGFALLGVATLDRLTYDFAAAERGYQALARRGDARLAAWAHLGLADAAEQRGWRRELLAELDTARALARRAGDREAEGWALVLGAITLANNHGTAEGLAALDTAARLLPTGAVAFHAERLRRRALILAVMQRPRVSAAAADSSVALARRAGLLGVEAAATRTIAIRLLYTGAQDSARPVLRRAEALYLRAGDHAGAAYTMLFRLDDETNRGLIGAARATAAAARREATTAHDDQSAATALVVDASLASRVGDYATAMRRLDTALALFRRLDDPVSAAMATGYRASVRLSLGQVAEAERDARAAVEQYRKTGYTSGTFEMWQLLAAVQIHGGRLAEAARSLAEARTLLRRHPDLSNAERLAYVEGWLALAGRRPGEARRRFAEALERTPADRGLERYDIRMHLALARARGGDLAGAEREATAASETLDRWRSTLSNEALRTLVFQTSPFDYSDRGTTAAEVLAALATGGRAEAAFALAERRRARALLDRLVGATVLQPAAVAEGALPNAWRAAGDRRFDAAAAVAALPDEHTALVELLTGGWGAPTTAFVVTRGGIRAFRLPPADSLAPAVARLVALLERGARPAALQRALGAALLDSIAAALPPAVTRLVVVPDGPLHHVPFDALVLGDARAAVERWAVGVAPSAAVVAALWARPRRTDAGPTRLLALGDPEFPREAPASFRGPALATVASAGGGTFRSAFAEHGGLARLAGSGDEARLVARYADAAEVRLRGDASAAWLLGSRLDGFRVVHLATHALVDDAGQARTAIALAPGGGEDGFVTPAELARLKLRADLVVLSACRTAGGVVVSGEGVQGLTAPLLAAGARSVVATGWRIGDRSTVRLVADFYDALARGLPVADALHDAKLAALRRGAPPGEWAAFTAVGDPLATVPLHAPRLPWLPRTTPLSLAAAAALLTAAAAGAAARARRRRARRERLAGAAADLHPVRRTS